MKAVILAGGLGKRLRPLTQDTPKSLVSIGGRPLIDIQLSWLRSHGISELVLCLGYLKDKIIDHLGNGSRFGVKVGYVVEEEPLGTAGAILNAEGFLRREENCIVINGDVITDLAPGKLVESIRGHVGAIALVPLKSPYGIVDLDATGRVRLFREKPLLEEYWINAGVYCLTPEIFNYLAERKNIETTAFPELAKEGKIAAVKYPDCFWKSIEVYKDIEEAEAELTRIGYLKTIGSSKQEKT